MQYRENPNREPPSEQTRVQYLNHWLSINRTLNLTEKTLTSCREMAAHSIRAPPMRRVRRPKQVISESIATSTTAMLQQLSARVIRSWKARSFWSFWAVRSDHGHHA